MIFEKQKCTNARAIARARLIDARKAITVSHRTTDGAEHGTTITARRGGFNAAVDPAKKGYCRTREGEVTQFVSFDGRWTSAYALRPRPAAQAVSLVEPR
jgi:hypothetical protein